MNNKVIRKKAYVDTNLCVACGACEKVCKLGAISVFKGMYAKVDLDKCVGCSMCAKECPASIIEIH